MVKVLKPGLYTTIQDKGRFGYRSLGVPISGTMDRISATMANRLLNNPSEAAVLEFTMMAPKLQFEKPTYISICGANFQPKLNNNLIELNKAVTIQEGDVLSFANSILGNYGYIAVSGGFQTPKVLGSQSFYKNITEKQKLEKGDIISFLGDSSEKLMKNASFSIDENYFNNSTIEVFSGPEFELLSTEFQKKIKNSILKIKPQSNRMACVLEGLETISASEIITGPVQPGTVQLTPSGSCVVLMKDAQTTGGYARILQLSEQSIGKLAQKMPGENVQFRLKKSPINM